MIGMFSDYIENGQDRNNAFLLKGLENKPENYYAAAQYCFDELTKQGKYVQSVVVCPKAQTYEEIYAIADGGLQLPSVAIPFVFV